MPIECVCFGGEITKRAKSGTIEHREEKIGILRTVEASLVACSRSVITAVTGFHSASDSGCEGLNGLRFAE